MQIWFGRSILHHEHVEYGLWVHTRHVALESRVFICLQSLCDKIQAVTSFRSLLPFSLDNKQSIITYRTQDTSKRADMAANDNRDTAELSTEAAALNVANAFVQVPIGPRSARPTTGREDAVDTTKSQGMKVMAEMDVSGGTSEHDEDLKEDVAFARAMREAQRHGHTLQRTKRA